MVELNAIQQRVLGSLIEKDITTPEYYPLSLNATVNASNQKSSRDPVMELSEADVRTALYELDDQGLVRTLSDARVPKFEHRVRDVLQLRRDEVAVVCLLLLRGPQTSAELRSRSERLYSFDDNAAVLATLERLASREEPLTIMMARQPGSRESRWAHLLGGAVDSGVAPAEPSGIVRTGLTERVEQLEELVRSLEARVKTLEGMETPGNNPGVDEPDLV
ncbi:MAG TPA: YceH family protein [Acidobacteriaceae bacterium]|jgi:hypothetical protein